METLKYDLQIPYPPSVNRYWRSVNGRNILSREARAYMENVRWYLCEKKIKPLASIKNKLSMDIFVYPPDNRRRDLDNVNKGILDILQKMGFYENDFQIDRLQLTRKAVTPKGFVQVKIYEIA